MSQPLPLLKPKKVSRDEMNLAEFPLTVLSTRGDPKIKTLEFRDTVKGKNGDVVERQWIITGADKFGLPTASDDEVLLGLLKLTVDDGMQSPKVFFTRYELLRILRWSTEGRNYSRLQRALDRLSGVRIKAANAFYDNEAKIYNTRNFGIIDGYEINDGRDPDSKSSFFTWSEVIFRSFQAGFIKKLDLDFYLDLKSAVSKRLYRYLDKHFWYRSRIALNLFVLSHEKIGISRNYRYASSLRQQLDPAVEELVRAGFLAKVEYEGKGAGTEVIFYAGKQRATPVSVSEENEPSRQQLELGVLGGGVGDDRARELQRVLVERGIREEQVGRLIAGQGPRAIEKMFAIIEYFDFLRESGSPRISRSPTGFLFHAIRNWETFLLPRERSGGVQTSLSLGSAAPSRMQRPERMPFTPPRSSSSSVSSSPNFSRSTPNLESEYLVARKQEIRRLRESIEESMLRSITDDVERALVKIRSQISEARFIEAVEHGVDERLARLFAVPDFEEWKREKRMS